MLPVTVEKLHSVYITCNYRVCTDSRNILPGSLFFCLHGPSFDGNDFALEALEKGAAFVVADRESVVTDDRILFCSDTTQMLQNLAAYHRSTLQTHILAIGGSNGKTTTKELCLAVLSGTLKVHATKANLNNHLGVPLTLLELDGSEDVGIIELGTNHPGEMKVLCDIVKPDSGILTNIGKEHLEGFGSIEEVAREESELYQALIKSGGMAFVNVDDPWLGNMSKRLNHIFMYGIQHDAELIGSIENEMPGLEFSLFYQNNWHGPYKAALGGSYNLYNILAAVSVGLHLGINFNDCAERACSYVAQNNRSEWRDLRGMKVWLDAYNANPSSVEAALRSFATVKGSKAVFLGDMLELGDFAEAEHRHILEIATDLGFDEIYTSGPEFMNVQLPGVTALPNTDALCEALRSKKVTADYLLIKGSRGMRMEKLLDVL